MSLYTLKTFSDIYTAVMEELKLQSTDTTNKNRIKRIINMIYQNEVVPASHWKWLRGRISLPIEARFNTGTVSCAQFSVNITFSSAPGPSKKGHYFSIDGQNEIYRIQQHAAGSTTAYLETPFIGSTATAYNFKTWTDALPLPTDCQETFEVFHNYHQVPLEGRGLQEFRRQVQPNPKAEGYPVYYSCGDFVDPTNFSSITSLPALTSRASSNQVKTLVFATDVSPYLKTGDRIQITSAGHYSYNGEVVVSSVATTNLTYTGPIVYNESATSDSALTVKLLNVEGTDERYRELLFYPSIWDKSITLHIDYLKQAPPLENDSDEPLIPIEDRIVLFYGALMMAWSSIGRNPEEAARNSSLFDRKLSKMSGKMDDSTDLPQLKPSMTYLRTKRNQGRAKDTRSSWAGVGGGSAGSSSQTVTGLANSVATFNNSSQLEGSSTITTTELNKLDGILSSAVGITDNQTLTNKTINAPSNTITNIADTNVASNAAIARSKIASGTASQVVTNDGSGVLSSEATLAKSRGGTGQDNSSLTFPASGTISTTTATVTLQNKTLDSTNTATLKDTLFTLQDDGDAAKQMQFQLSGITSGQTRTLTVPDASTTLVGTAVTQTLQNKTLDDTNAITVKDGSLTLENTTTATKKAVFDLSGITAANTRTLTIPDSSLTIVGTAVQQTITSKVYQHAVTATKVAGYTAGTNDETIRGDSSGGTFNFTLPTAAGITGQRYRFVKVDTSLIQIGFATTSSQTIAGLAASFYKLATPGEFWEFESDGTNWQVYAHWYDNRPVAYTPVFTGFGTAASVSFYSWRKGPSLCIQGVFTSGTVTGSTSAITLGYNGTSANVSSSANYGTFVVGHGNLNTSASTFFGELTCIATASATTFGVGLCSSTVDGTAATTGTNLGSTKNIKLYAEIMIDGWTG